MKSEIVGSVMQADGTISVTERHTDASGSEELLLYSMNQPSGGSDALLSEQYANLFLHAENITVAARTREIQSNVAGVLSLGALAPLAHTVSTLEDMLLAIGSSWQGLKPTDRTFVCEYLNRLSDDNISLALHIDTSDVPQFRKDVLGPIASGVEIIRKAIWGING